MFYEGDVVAFDGGTFQALRDTGQPPSHKDWLCLAVAGRDARSPQVRGTFKDGAAYTHLDIVAHGGGSFIARRDNPGPCPGEGWQLLASQGRRGDKGERGPQGERGPMGTPGIAPKLKDWMLDCERYLATPIMSDGSHGPALDLRVLFEQFHNEVFSSASPGAGASAASSPLE